VSDDYKIYVDGGQPATLNNGAGALTKCPTLQEAVLDNLQHVALTFGGSRTSVTTSRTRADLFRSLFRRLVTNARHEHS
jgi:hypothetical protein